MDKKIKKWSAFILLLIIVGAFICLTKELPRIGDPQSPPNTHVSDYYIEHSEEDTGSPNIVSGTLADYRGFDTMWETTVMFVSGLTGTLILVWDRTKKGESV